MVSPIKKDFGFTVMTGCPVGFENRDGACVLPKVKDFQIVLGNTDDEGLGAGSVSGIVIGVLLAAGLVAMVVMYKRTSEENNKQMLTELSNDQDSQPLFLSGVHNPMYAWYDPNASREATYARLATAQPGDFVVRDLKDAAGVANPMYAIHVKTGKGIIRDEVIAASGTYMTLASASTPQPAFGAVPDLVAYYGANTDQPFVLNVSSVSNPMYSAMYLAGGEDIYDNADIKNSAVLSDAPALAPKRGDLAI